MKTVILWLTIAFASVAASANTINFDTPTGVLGLSHDYDGVEVYGFAAPTVPWFLDGSSNGLGLLFFPGNDIAGLGFVEIAAANIDQVQVETLSNSHWIIGESNVLGEFGIPIEGGIPGGDFDVSTSEKYLTVEFLEGGGYLQAVAMPEPGAFWLAAAGLALVLCARARQNVR